MSTLTVQPIPEVFSTIPELCESLAVFRGQQLAEGLIPRLGELFVRYNVFDLYGLSMVHRHFDMTPDEILVETVKRDKSMSVFVPWSVKAGLSANPTDISAWSSYQMNDCERKYIVPQHWSFVEGKLIPFEFLATDDPSLNPQPSEDFAKELFCILKDYGVEKYVGIRRLLHLREHSSWETTPEGVRANVTVFGEKPEHLKSEEMVQVVWAFDKEGKVCLGTAWCGICSNNCGSCNR